LLSVSEVIALKLRRPGSGNEYLYPQIFAGLSCVLASVCLLELWHVQRVGRIRRNTIRETTQRND